MHLWILLEVLVERFQIAESLRLRDGEHLIFDFRHALQTELMNLFSRKISCSLMTHSKAIARLPIRQSPHARIEPPVRRVIFAHELGESSIGGPDFALHRAFNLFS